MSDVQGLLNMFDWTNAPQTPREAGAPGNKGLGYFGVLDRPGGYSTELAVDQIDPKYGRMDYPLLVPTLTQGEIQHLLSGGKPTEAIYEKAYQHALSRGLGAKSPFATPFDVRTIVK